MLQRSRVLAVTTLTAVLLLFLVLEGRLFQLQVVNRAKYYRDAVSRSFTKRTIPTPRGDIKDRGGDLLATTVPALSVYCNVNNLDRESTPEDEMLLSTACLAEALEMDVNIIRNRITAPGRSSYRCLKRRETNPKKILALYRLEEERALRGYDLEVEYQRVYPHKDFLGHTLGHVSYEGGGLSGLEQVFDAFLAGREGQRFPFIDGGSRELFHPDEWQNPGMPGGSLTLTVDSTIQLFCEIELANAERKWNPKWTAAVVLEPATGRILGAAGTPTLDPSKPGRGSEHRWLNRVFGAEYIPGSTFKPLFMTMVHNMGLLNPTQKIDCEGGHWRVRGRRVSDVHVNYRHLNAPEILIKSSNIGMSKLALRVAPAECPKGGDALRPAYDTMRLLGFGRPTGVLPPPIEHGGKLTDFEDWTSVYTLISLSFGNEIAVTPIQMAAAFAAIANAGLYVPPRLVDRIEFPDGRTHEPPRTPARRVFFRKLRPRRP